MNGKWKIPLIAVIVFLSFFALSALSAEFWGSKNTNKYHYPTCKWALNIKADNLVKFKSPEDAVEAGYVPCKVCKPPLTTKGP